MLHDSCTVYFTGNTSHLKHGIFSSFDGEFFKSLGSSIYSHKFAGIANYKGKALTTGCGDSELCYIKTELMDMNTKTWTGGPDYPFTLK